MANVVNRVNANVNVGTTADPIVTRLVQDDKVPWYKKPNLRVMYIWVFLCCMGVEMTSGFDSQLINTLQFSESFQRYFGGGRVDENGKYAIEPGLLGFVNSCYQLGSIFAVPIAPWVAQRWGRRWSIMIGSLIMVVGALIQERPVVPGRFRSDAYFLLVAMYIIARILLGMGILFAIISGAALIGELSYPKERPVLTSLFNSSYFIGQILASAIALGTTEIKKSPRYLISHDKVDEASNILIKYHAEGDGESLLVKAEIAQIRETIKTEMEVSKQSWLDLIRQPGMRRRVYVSIFLGLFTQLSGNTLISYYSNILFDMMGFTSSYAKTRINVANACWGLINGTIIALIVTRFKRRHMYMLSATCMCLVFTAFTVSLQRLQVADDAGMKNTAAGISTLFWYFAHSPSYNIGNNALTYTYLIELWPYAQRSRGIGVQQLFGKLAGFFSTNVNSIALNAIGWRYLAIYCGWIFFELCIIFFLYPETSGRTLEELAFLFEDKEYNERMAAAVEKNIRY
ncbi:related to hexose transporter protein [Cephalotrichum gorgonifer]|uniref:Related to hexose transporter protein n=1 Tax=Cephalotrichum gorgonifer TaxID=2041049 RepID=A0AAE8SUI7_9PEZI|nr:related to hexose transporter protein [Cephalotrichum gorgonifer]